MIGADVSPLPAGTKVYLCCEPTDMRNGFAGLSARVKAVLNKDPFSGQLFVFRGKTAGYIKILRWDGSGLCLFAKRLERGRFVWPPLIKGAVTLTPAQLALLVEGRNKKMTIPPEPPLLPMML